MHVYAIQNLHAHINDAQTQTKRSLYSTQTIRQHHQLVEQITEQHF